MTYKRFSQLWKEHVTNRVKSDVHKKPDPGLTGVHEGSPFLGRPASQRTIDALIEYGQGDTRMLDDAKRYLDDSKKK